MSTLDATQIRWHKARASVANGNCVEVGQLAGSVLVRDSKNPDGAVLDIRPDVWTGFVAGLKNGEFN